MRNLLILSVALILTACSKASDGPLASFDAYLALRPDSKVKVVPYIGGSAAGVPGGIGGKLKEVERGVADSGVVVSVTKRELTVRLAGSNTNRTFAPEEVRSIEIIKE